MGDPHDTLGALQAQLDQWEALLAGLSEQQITAPQLDDGWSIKDVVAHLHAWQLRSLARVRAALSGAEPEYPDWPAEHDPEQPDEPHDLNAWLHAAYRDQPWPSVYQSWHEGFRQLLELGAAVPEADLLEQDKYPWIAGYALIDVLKGSLEHHREHAENLGR